MVCINAVFVGIQADNTHSDLVADNIGFFVVDCFFFIFFMSETYIRITQHRWEYFFESWNLFDYFVIALTLFDIACAVVTGVTGGFRLVLAVRILRCARIIRYIRGMKAFQSLWMTIKGLADALKTMLWVAAMLMILVYCAAIATLTVINTEDEWERWISKDIYLGTVWNCMWTILQLITFDAWATDIMIPLMPMNWIAASIFFLMIILGSFGVINVILAVLVESARSNSQESRAYAAKIMQKFDEEIIRSLGYEFFIADDDGSGELEEDEFFRFCERPDVHTKMKMIGVREEEAHDLFTLIDADGSGAISAEEFVNGLRKLRGNAKGSDIVPVISFATKQVAKAKNKVERMRHLNAQADKVVERVTRLGGQMTDELRQRTKIDKRTEDMWFKTNKRQQVLNHIDGQKEGFYPGLSKLLEQTAAAKKQQQF